RETRSAGTKVKGQRIRSDTLNTDEKAPQIPSCNPTMAFATRLLTRSTRQVYSGQSVMRPECVVAARSFAKGAGTAPPALKGDELLKGIFLEVKNKFETAIGVIRKEKITIDPDNPAAVAEYAKVMKTAREKANLFSESERIKYTIESRTQDIPDARSYLLALKDIRVKRGLVDELGAEAMMMDALDKVEKELKKPLLRNDKKGMALLKAEFDKVNQKLGIRREDLPKYEEQLELKIAKAQLEELKKGAVEAMETQKKRDEFKDEELPDVKSLDIRNFI
ncbi:Probable ATP synthase 24 kDa subunit-mitochondrial, partial [Striga hermonthica]